MSVFRHFLIIFMSYANLSKIRKPKTISSLNMNEIFPTLLQAPTLEETFENLGMPPTISTSATWLGLSCCVFFTENY